MHDTVRSKPVLKVCHVAVGDLWAGAEVHLLALMRYLVRLSGFEWSVILFNEGKLADELRKLPIQLMVVPEKDNGPVAIAYHLVRTFKRIRPDIVHTHKYKDSVLGTIVARCLRVPHVIRVVHGLPEPFGGLKSMKMICYTIVDRVVTSRLIDKVIAVSREIHEVLTKVYGANKVMCIHNGIDLENVHVTTQRSEARKEWHIDDKAVVVGTVGRLVLVKGHTVLLRAVRVLRTMGMNVTLLLVGDGPLREQLEAEVQRLELGQSVIFVGHQEQVYDFINMMDIFVLPSLHEGIPMVLLEALALKRSVIASRVGGIPEVVLNGQSGLLVRPSNVDELASSLREMIQDPCKASELGTMGRSHIEQEFDASMMANRTAALYRSL